MNFSYRIKILCVLCILLGIFVFLPCLVFAGETKDLSGSDKIPDNTRWPRTITIPKSELTSAREGFVLVPHLFRYTPVKAKNVLFELGLRWRFKEEKPTDYSEFHLREVAGKIHRQIPEAGEWVKPGTYVTMTLAPENVVRIPDILGTNEDVAEFRIEKSGLRFRIEEDRLSQTGPFGVINWKPYYYAYPDDIIDVTVVYPEVPNLIGRSLEEARIICETASLVLKTKVIPIRGVLEFEKLARQDPAPGSKSFPGDVVRAYLPQKEARVPDVSLLLSDKAEEILEEAGLYARFHMERPDPDLYQTFPPPAIKDKIWRQSPAPGSVIDISSGVDLYVGSAGGLSLPNLLEMTEKEANKVLEELGLKMNIRRALKSSYLPRGIVDWSPKYYAYEGDAIFVDIEYPEAPVLRGLSKKDAVNAIRNARLVPRVEEIDLVDEHAGVYEQNPPPGTRMLQGEVVSASVAIRLF